MIKEKVKWVYKLMSSKYMTLFQEYPVDFKPRYGWGKPPHDILYQLVNKERQTYSDLIDSFLQYQDVFHQIKQMKDQQDENQPSWNNKFLPGLDIISIYGILSKFKPKRYVEIGSGNSTKVVRKAIKDQNLPTQITSLDPFPRANIDHLSDTVIRRPIELIEDLSILTNLDAGDILFLDGSHACFPNSDVMVFFMEVFPKLKKGVIVHVHDIYIPYDYPQFMCDRFYAEQYILSAFMMANPEKYKTLFPCYFVSEDKELASKLEPVWNHPNLQNVEKHGGSFWLQVC